MNKKITKKEQEESLPRNFKITISLNEKEYNMVSRYLDKYKILNKNRWFRETILLHILNKLEENHPTLFNEQEMRR